MLALAPMVMFSCGCSRKGSAPAPPDAHDPVPQQVEADAVPYTILYRGYARHPTARKECRLITDREAFVREWNELRLQGEPPAVDFERHQALLIYESYSSSPADLDILEITKSEAAATVTYRFNIHPEAVMVLPKALVVSIPVLNVPLEVVRHEWFNGEEEIGVETLLPANR